MILYIDTSDQKTVKVGLKENDKFVDELSAQNQFGSQALLPLIEKLLKRTGVKLSHLEGVQVETGPGSFTGLRVGVSVANALGFSLGIPVNGKKIETDLVY